jgi:hypothetical protein
MQPLLLARVHRPVDLEDQPRLEADEIGDIAGERHLPPELEAVETPVPELTPQRLLQRGRLLAQAPCQAALAGRDLVAGMASPLPAAGGAHVHPLTRPAPPATLPHEGGGLNRRGRAGRPATEMSSSSASQVEAEGADLDPPQAGPARGFGALVQVAKAASRTKSRNVTVFAVSREISKEFSRTTRAISSSISKNNSWAFPKSQH